MELTVLIFHGDCPAAAALLDERNRDLSLPLDELRAQMRATNPDSIFVPYACLPQMRRGGIACVLRKIVARWVLPGSLLLRLLWSRVGIRCRSGPAGAVARARKQRRGCDDFECGHSSSH